MSTLKDDTERVRRRLIAAQDDGNLGVVAARYNLLEGALRDFADGNDTLTQEEIIYLARRF